MTTVMFFNKKWKQIVSHITDVFDCSWKLFGKSLQQQETSLVLVTTSPLALTSNIWECPS